MDAADYCDTIDTCINARPLIRLELPETLCARPFRQLRKGHRHMFADGGQNKESAGQRDTDGRERNSQWYVMEMTMGGLSFCIPSVLLHCSACKVRKMIKQV